jgi:hypothetical protein
MKKLLTLGLFIAFIAGTLNAAVQNDKKSILGDWNYEAATAPYGYEKGKLIFAEKEGELTGVVQFADGTKVDLTKITYENGVLKCGLYLEYNYIGIETKVEGKKMAGSVDSPDGKIEIKAEKAE